MRESRDGLTPDDTRLERTLAALRDLPIVENERVARVAARAVLASSPTERRAAWSLRIAATITVVALGAAAIAASRARDDAQAKASRDERSRDGTFAALPGGATPLTPVIETSSRAIVFELDAPTAHSVQVLGDFNQWSRTGSAMQRGSDGHWRLTTLLPPGRYVYAFLVDGQRFERDLLRDAVEDRDFGVTGSELVVGEAP